MSQNDNDEFWRAVNPPELKLTPQQKAGIIASAIVAGVLLLILAAIGLLLPFLSLAALALGLIGVFGFFNMLFARESGPAFLGLVIAVAGFYFHRRWFPDGLDIYEYPWLSWLFFLAYHAVLPS